MTIYRVYSSDGYVVGEFETMTEAKICCLRWNIRHPERIQIVDLDMPDEEGVYYG